MHKPLTEQICDMRLEGKSPSDIARTLSVSLDCVNNALSSELLDVSNEEAKRRERAVSAARLDRLFGDLLAASEVVEAKEMPRFASAGTAIERQRGLLLGLHELESVKVDIGSPRAANEAIRKLTGGVGPKVDLDD